MALFDGLVALGSTKGQAGIGLASSLTARVGGITQTLKAAEASSTRQRAIARENRFLRSIQARRLIGQIRTTTAARGVSGGTAADLVADAAFLEGIDIARSGFREEALAAQVDAAALADALQTGLGFAQDLDRYREVVGVAERALDLERANDSVTPGALRGIPGLQG